MDSMNRDQSEKHHEDLFGRDAINKIKEIVDKTNSCFFCTAVSTPGSSGARPMAVREVDDVGNLWFLSASDTHKDQELAIDPSVRLYFQASSHSDFLEINGDATVSRDRARIKQLWEPMLKTWFTDEDDPRITVIKVAPTDGHYWDTKHGQGVAGVKMMIGAALGKRLDDSMEGALRV
jgi:general stress protein 26